MLAALKQWAAAGSDRGVATQAQLVGKPFLTQKVGNPEGICDDLIRPLIDFLAYRILTSVARAADPSAEGYTRKIKSLSTRVDGT